jgi:hypothetical protein
MLGLSSWKHIITLKQRTLGDKKKAAQDVCAAGPSLGCLEVCFAKPRMLLQELRDFLLHAVGLRERCNACLAEDFEL